MVSSLAKLPLWQVLNKTPEKGINTHQLIGDVKAVFNSKYGVAYKALCWNLFSPENAKLHQQLCQNWAVPIRLLAYVDDTDTIDLKKRQNLRRLLSLH